MQEFQPIEGIVLRKFPFKEHDEIVAAITPTHGLVKLVVKGALKKQYRLVVLGLAEFSVRTSEKELWSCRETHLLHAFDFAKGGYDCLTCAAELGADLLSTLQIHAPNPLLYQMLLAFLRKLPVSQNPRTLQAAFRLKLLMQEGLLSEEALHTLSDAEKEICRYLTTSRSLQALDSITIPEELSHEVHNLLLQKYCGAC